MICLVASTPFNCGIATSITTTSGCNSSASFTAAWPVSASPTTSISGVASSKARNPSRTTLWSSANRTLILLIVLSPAARAGNDMYLIHAPIIHKESILQQLGFKPHRNGSSNSNELRPNETHLDSRHPLSKVSLMAEIKFGTDGWRAVIAEDFTFSNVERVSQATADYWRLNPVPDTGKKII